MNCFITIKWTLTENNPTIKFYSKDRWTEIYDNLTMPIQPTLSFVKGLHFCLAYLIDNLSKTKLEKIFTHPENNKEFKIKEIIGTYAWHGNLHLSYLIEVKRLQILAEYCLGNRIAKNNYYENWL